MLVFKKVREGLGFTKCRTALVGAAPIHRETLEFFMAIDIPILELYGMSESTGPQTLSLKSSTQWRTGSCGKSMSGAETKIGGPDENGDGEVSDCELMKKFTLCCSCKIRHKGVIRMLCISSCIHNRVWGGAQCKIKS